MLTDQEFRHYQSLYNLDPVVQRLCNMDFVEREELESKIADLEDEIDTLNSDANYMQDELDDLRDENEELHQKIKMWETLEKPNESL